MPDGTVPAGQRDVLAQALADAVYYRDPPLECVACETGHVLCAACAGTLAIARSYLALSRQLGFPGNPT